MPSHAADPASELAELPSFQHCVDVVIEAERGEGWLAACAERDRYVVLSREFADALAELLGRLESQQIVEICAGDGQLARALRRRQLRVTATDAQPAGPDVQQLSAREALERFQPRTVIGCFVPLGAQIDRLVCDAPSVRHYVIVTAAINGHSGLPSAPPDHWKLEPLPGIARWLICRHDAWLSDRQLLQRGEVWLAKRSDSV